ncbi:ImmA/IrrE family metallo-endopeptidase [Prescottella equi]|uniref:ImmA/IrrE family metallo-endopeptidase n=1 Tax=Rhodococcus hoagii TaxID=43767 RepID=UPI0009B64E7E|nr:ImmA/IrrE family metallo-endopeptidase [Prescottella equi]
MNVAVTATPLNISTSGINDYAVRVGEAYGIYSPDGCADLDHLLQQLGGEVEVRDGVESLAIDKKSGTFTVFVPGHTSPRRDRFTIAHEVGHYLLHHLNADEGNRLWRFTRLGSNGAETQANIFAAALIMPEAHFRRAYSELNGNVHAIASRFDVSPAAASVRCSVLGLNER